MCATILIQWLNSIKLALKQNKLQTIQKNSRAISSSLNMKPFLSFNNFICYCQDIFEVWCTVHYGTVQYASDSSSCTLPRFRSCSSGQPSSARLQTLYRPAGRLSIRLVLQSSDATFQFECSLAWLCRRASAATKPQIKFVCMLKF